MSQNSKRYKLTANFWSKTLRRIPPQKSKPLTRIQLKTNHNFKLTYDIAKPTEKLCSNNNTNLKSTPITRHITLERSNQNVFKENSSNSQKPHKTTPNPILQGPKM
jgi:hypothetical protein